MKNKQFRTYYLLSCIGVLIASYYPLSMGIRVITDMIVDGTVLKENYPKYIIPYTPISIAIIAGVILMPLWMKLFRRFALGGGAVSATGVFFALELLFERNVVVTTAETVTKLEDWQMYMCYIPPGGWGEAVTTYKSQTAVDILMGDYNPAFKLHFYLISIVLIITVVNCIYGFGQRIKTGNKKRTRALILQSACSLAFLGLCILACFTAFWRDGSIQVSALSAILMTVFFLLFGISVGVFVGSFLLETRKTFSVLIPSVVSAVMTLLMYMGEMILLNGHLYQLGTGFFFENIPGIVFAPIDLLVIVVSGCITAWIFILLNNSPIRHKVIFLALSVIGIAAILGMILCFGSSGNSSFKPVCDEPEVICTVSLLETISDEEFSSYQVGADLPSTDFSSVSQMLKQTITREWNTYDGMTPEQRWVSSHLWGLITIKADTWEECEEKIGLTVDNPLESLDFLNKTGYFGSQSVLPDLPVTHVQATAYATEETDRTLSQINVTAGYNHGNVRVTLTATLSENTAPFISESICHGFATYEERTTATGSGRPVLIVTTHETNNTGYYQENYDDPTAYWGNGNVFYTLRVIAEEADQAEIQAVLNRILEAV